MDKTINVGNKKNAIKILNQFKDNNYVEFDIRITNTHITRVNDLIPGASIFQKDDVYIDSHTLWEIMQDLGGKGQHNYHGLTPDDVFMALTSLKEPEYLFVAKDSRFAVITSRSCHFGIQLMIVIEIGAATKKDAEANINKIVTIYPKDGIDRLIRKIDKKNLLYSKK